MPNDTREGALRGARLSTGITDQDTRLGFGREDHLGRGSVVNYYEDIDYSTSADNANLLDSKKKILKTGGLRASLLLMSIRKL